MDGALGVFYVGHVGGGNATRIRRDGDAVGDAADGGERGEDCGVHNPRRGEEAEPAVDEDEHGGDVNVCDGQNDDAHWEREGGGLPLVGGHRGEVEAPPARPKRRRLRERARESALNSEVGTRIPDATFAFNFTSSNDWAMTTTNTPIYKYKNKFKKYNK